MLLLMELKAAVVNALLSLYTRLAVFKIVPSRPLFSLGYGYYTYYLTR